MVYGNPCLYLSVCTLTESVRMQSVIPSSPFLPLRACNAHPVLRSPAPLSSLCPQPCSDLSPQEPFVIFCTGHKSHPSLSSSLLLSAEVFPSSTNKIITAEFYLTPQASAKSPDCHHASGKTHAQEPPMPLASLLVSFCFLPLNCMFSKG